MTKGTKTRSKQGTFGRRLTSSLFWPRYCCSDDDLNVSVLRGIKFEELCAGIQKANVATPTAPFPPTPTGIPASTGATPRNSNTTDEQSTSFPQDEGEVSDSVVSIRRSILSNLSHSFSAL